MIEVELKTKISSPKIFRAKTRQIAEYIGKEKKTDYYYTLEPPGKYPKKSLRIRKKGKIYEINFKQRISYANGIHVKNEEEFNLKSIKNFLDLIKDFGFKRWLIKEKITELYKIKDNFHIELNYVKHLGWFLEIEYLVKNKSKIHKARKEILKILRKLGTKGDIIKEGYTLLLWKKKLRFR